MKNPEIVHSEKCPGTVVRPRLWKRVSSWHTRLPIFDQNLQLVLFY
jgi:hypothetical protein